MVSAQVRLALQAMRYYRLWIYASNAVLIFSVVVFICVAASLLSDPRKAVITPSTVSLQQPSLFYAYAALFLQGGILPIVGCVGALRLSERLLHSYWIILLVLLGGDLFMGLIWIFRFQKLITGLIPDLKARLATDYGQDQDFTQAWDFVQRVGHCCGAESPNDFNSSYWVEILSSEDSAWRNPNQRVVVPDSCCRMLSLPEAHWTRVVKEVPPGRKEVYGTGKHRQQLREFSDRFNDRFLAVTSSAAPLTSGTPVSNPSSVSLHSSQTLDEESHSVRRLVPALEVNGSVCWRIWPSSSGDVYETSCGEFLLNWVHTTSDVLFILGYCVLTFVKLCFAAILRYELREMVQKIKILRGEIVAPFQELSNILAMTTSSLAQNNTQITHTPPTVVAVEEESLTVSATDQTTTNSPTNTGLPTTMYLSVNGDLSSAQLEYCDIADSADEHSSLLGSKGHLRYPRASQSSNHITSFPHFSEVDVGHHGDTAADKEWSRVNENRSAARTNGNNNEYHELREIKQTEI